MYLSGTNRKVVTKSIMKGINVLFNSVKQGVGNLRKNRMFTLASVGTVAACLFVFGLFYFVISNFQNIIHEAESSVGVSVFFEEQSSEEQIREIGELIRRRGSSLRKIIFQKHLNWRKVLEKTIRSLIQHLMRFI